MATQATYIGVVPRTIIADPNNANIGIGLRVTVAAGVAALAISTVRGDFVTLSTIEAGQPGEAVSMQSAGTMFYVAAVVFAVDDPVYSAANGQVTNLSAGAAIYIGKAQNIAAIGALVQVEMQNPA